MTNQLAELDRRFIWHPFTQMQRWSETEPLVIAAADGNYLIDTSGRRYLDGVSSLWVNVHGHRCSEIDDAIRAQLDKVAHTTLLGLANVPSIELAEALVRVAPPGLNHVFYSDSGSTAVEVALKMAFQYWQLHGQTARTRFITLDNAYHGDTVGSVSVGGIDLFHKIFHPLLFQAYRVPSPHPYRFAKGDAADCREHCLDALATCLNDHAEEVAALIIEPRVQGAAGMIVHPDGFLAKVSELCRKHDVLLICDEVATGFGRTGTLFSCEAESVRPDLMAIAKGLSGGYLPLAATLASDRIFEAFLGERKHTFFHGHSYTGNPLACAAALASLRLFETRDVLTAVNVASTQMAQLLSERIVPLPWVGDIRQKGLMTGIEIVHDRKTKQSFPEDQLIGARVCHAARKRGVILRPLGDVIVLMPPLSITGPEIELLVDSVSAAAEEVLA